MNVITGFMTQELHTNKRTLTCGGCPGSFDFRSALSWKGGGRILLLWFITAGNRSSSGSNPEYMECKFIGSFPSVEKMPPAGLPEFVFIGRSNVGKSSLINMLVDHKNLAHTSSTPGKTQMINLFQVGETYQMVDLPGYGYARLSKKHRNSLMTMIRTYLRDREALFLVFLLLDIRVTPQKVDMEMLYWLGTNGIPVSLLFTKADKLKPVEIRTSHEIYEAEILKSWNVMPTSFLTSAQVGKGREAVLNYIATSLSPEE